MTGRGRRRTVVVSVEEVEESRRLVYCIVPLVTNPWQDTPKVGVWKKMLSS